MKQHSIISIILINVIQNSKIYEFLNIQVFIDTDGDNMINWKKTFTIETNKIPKIENIIPIIFIYSVLFIIE